MNRAKLIFIVGTRPEAIKLAPVIGEARKKDLVFNTKVIATGQHLSMLDQILEIFRIDPDYNLKVMEEDQSPASVASKAIKGIYDIVQKEKPDLIIVQGDTTSTFAGALAGYYSKVPIAHVEAGLRTYNKFHPFPEEVNRTLVAHIADYHFAPTLLAKQNLISEGINTGHIWITGNTGIDALFQVIKLNPVIDKRLKKVLKTPKKRTILVTAHRRENRGAPLEKICKAMLKVLRKFKDTQIVFPVHLAPQINTMVKECFKDNDRVFLFPPLNYPDFVYAMKESYLILTDSGGVQEEAPSLGKPVLVLRETTERPEALTSGCVKIAGTDTDRIYHTASYILENEDEYKKMSSKSNPFGDGTASYRIMDILEEFMIPKIGTQK
jgi:UDP-N-acetylglucosamine 2-epimerase (non-hydrolysing)